MKKILILITLSLSLSVSADFMKGTADFLKRNTYVLPCVAGAAAATVLSDGNVMGISAAVCATSYAHHLIGDSGNKPKGDDVDLNSMKTKINSEDIAVNRVLIDLVDKKHSGIAKNNQKKFRNRITTRSVKRYIKSEINKAIEKGRRAREASVEGSKGSMKALKVEDLKPLNNKTSR